MTAAAPTGTAVDQRTGEPMVIGGIPAPAQQAQQRKALSESQQREHDELVAQLEQEFAAQVTSGDGIVDMRRLNSLVGAELARRAESGEAKIQPTRRAAPDKAPDKAQYKAATKEAEALTAELDTRAAWLFQNQIVAAAVRRRYLEAGNRLMELTRQHNLPTDVGRYTTLAVRAQELAGRYQQMIENAEDRDLWRQDLPELQPLELPQELRASGVVVDHATNQRMRVPLAAGAIPSPRNPDGTLAGSDPGFNPAPPPRTEAQERAKRKEIEAAIATEDAGS